MDQLLEPLRDVRAARLHAVHTLEDRDRLGHETVVRELVGQSEQDRYRLHDPAGLHQQVGELESHRHRGGEAPLELPPQRVDGLATLPLCDQLADVGVEGRVEPVQGHRDFGPGATPRIPMHASPRKPMERWAKRLRPAEERVKAILDLKVQIR